MRVSPACAPWNTALAPSFDLVGGERGRHPDAGRGFVLAAGAHFVVGDDEDRIQVLIAARHRFLEEHRAALVVEVVVDEARELARIDHAGDLEPVANLDVHLVAADDDGRARQVIQARRAVALDFVLHQAGVGARREARHRDAFAGEVGAQAREAAVVLGELGDREAGVEIAEQRDELAALDLEVQLVLRSRLVALLGAVAVQQIVAVGLDRPVDTLARVVLLARRVVSHGQQEVALDAALGEERHAAAVLEAIFTVGGRRRFHVARDGVVRRGAFGDADQDPVARRGREPHFVFIALALVEAQAYDRVAADRGGLELDEREAVLAHFDLRLARARGENLVVVELLDFPPGAVRRIDAEVRDRARARRLAVLVEHAQRDHRARAAVGDEFRGFLVDLGTHRAAAVVHRALRRPDDIAVRIENFHRKLVVAVDQVDAAPAAQRHRTRIVEADAVVVQLVHRDAIQGELGGLLRIVRDGDLDRRDRRHRVRLGRQPADAGRQRVDVDQLRADALRSIDAVAHAARAGAARAAQHDAHRFHLLRLTAGLDEFERRVRFEACAFDDDFDTAIGGEAGGILAGIDRLVRAVAFDVHTGFRNVQRDGEVVSDRLRARLGQRVVVGVDLAAARGNLLRVGVADRANGDVARAAPGVDEVAQRGFVGQRELGLEHIEARRERELRAAVTRGAAIQL